MIFNLYIYDTIQSWCWQEITLKKYKKPKVGIKMEYEKEELFNQWFALEVRKRASAGKSFDTQIQCHQHALNTHFENLYQKYKSQMNHEDFISECVYWAYQALDKFTLLDGTWDGLVDGTDKKNIGRLINYIKTTVQSNAIRFANPNTRFTTRNIGGKRKNAKIVFTYTSLDALITAEDGTQTALVEFIDSNANLFSNPHARYQMNEFIQWFEANKHTFLKKSYIALLDNLPRALNEVDNTFNAELLKKEAGIRSNHLNYYLDKIKLKTMEAWELERKGRTTMPRYIVKRDKKLKSYVALLNNEETTDADIQRWIVKGCQEEEWLEDVIQKGLKLPHLKNLNRCINGVENMSKQTLYAVNENLVRAEEISNKDVREATMRAITTSIKEENKVTPQPKPITGNTFYLDTYGNEILSS